MEFEFTAEFSRDCEVEEWVSAVVVSHPLEEAGKDLHGLDVVTLDGFDLLTYYGTVSTDALYAARAERAAHAEYIADQAADR